MTVADVSALIDALQAVPGPARDALASLELPLAAPHLVDLEFTSACRRLVLQHKLSVSEAEELLRRFRALPIERHEHEALVPRIWELRDRVGAYDAAYLALAERLNASVLTSDARLGRIDGIRAAVHVIGS